MISFGTHALKQVKILPDDIWKASVLNRTIQNGYLFQLQSIDLAISISDGINDNTYTWEGYLSGILTHTLQK